MLKIALYNRLFKLKDDDKEILFLAVFAASLVAKQAPNDEAAKTRKADANLSSLNLTPKDKNAKNLNLTRSPPSSAASS